jgi:hypothetical protein
MVLGRVMSAAMAEEWREVINEERWRILAVRHGVERPIQFRFNSAPTTMPRGNRVQSSMARAVQPQVSQRPHINQSIVDPQLMVLIQEGQAISYQQPSQVPSLTARRRWPPSG